MKIVKPSAEVFFHVPWDAHTDSSLEPKRFLEVVGRTCYKSEDRMTGDSASKFIRMLRDRGHHAMLEHCFASVKFVCDRGVSHELVRHRLASHAQESTRYCNYGKDKFGAEISVIEPPGLNEEQRLHWLRAVEVAEKAYLGMLESGCPPQIARSVLPTCLKTEVWASANLREWMHIFKLRCSSAAHPQIREVMDTAQKFFTHKVPELFAEV